MSPRIAVVSAGMVVPKKGDLPYLRRHFYVNYGAVGLATCLSARTGIRCPVIHGRFYDPAQVAAETAAECDAASLVLLSIPSARAIEWAAIFVRRLAELNPRTAIVLGGRWTVPTIIQDRKGEFENVSSFVTGFGEQVIDEVLSDFTRSRLKRLYDGSGTASAPFTHFDYTLCADYQELTPSLEVGRGCGLGCAFCVERDVRLSALKSPESVAQEIRSYVNLFGTPLNFYFECSLFAPSDAWADRLASALSSVEQVAWRTETRADLLTPTKVRKLAGAGLRVLDIGLESASPKQLVAMGKSASPSSYLDRASTLLQACYDAGIITKVNILLWAGETSETVGQTMQWLDRHRRFITGVSVGPVIGYGTVLERRSFREELATLGAVPVSHSEGEYWDEFHLSKEIDAAGVSELSTKISREFMSAAAYFELKSFSYFERSYSFEQFRTDLSHVPQSQLQFSVAGMGNSLL